MGSATHASSRPRSALCAAGRVSSCWRVQYGLRVAMSGGGRCSVARAGPGAEAAPAAAPGAAGGSGSGPGGAVAHAASTPRIAGHHALRRPAPRWNCIDMWVILLEALGALVLLVAIVWWT